MRNAGQYSEFKYVLRQGVRFVIRLHAVVPEGKTWAMVTDPLDLTTFKMQIEASEIKTVIFRMFGDGKVMIEHPEEDDATTATS